MGGGTIRSWPSSPGATAPLSSEAGRAAGDSAAAPHAGEVDFGAFGLDESSWNEDDSGQSHLFAFKPGLVFADRYELGARIARGGMGSVWAATDQRLGREVAMKFMAPDLVDDEESRYRFEQEARAAAKLSSRHVVGIHDHGVSEGIPFIVLERLEGEDLHKRLRQVERFSLEVCDRILTEACKALRAAHDAGIVHRDIKPQNLFLAQAQQSADGEEVLKLLDFGVAKHAGTHALRTKTGVLVGSPHFMSPEQVKGQRNVDFRSDLFSLASVVYRCVTGARPYDGSMPQVLLAISKGPPAAPSSVAPGLPPALDGFFARALAVDPQARFESATAMAAAFHAIVVERSGATGEPAVEPPRLTHDNTLTMKRVAPSFPPVRQMRASEHPTMVAEPGDSGGPRSDAPTQMVPENQLHGFTQAMGPEPLGPSPWDQGRAWQPAPVEVDRDAADLLGRRASRMALVVVGGLIVLLVLLIGVLALLG